MVRAPRGDVVIEVDGALTVALDHTLDDELIHEGWARELTSKLQRMRKDGGLAVTDRIRLRIASTDAELLRAIETHADHIGGEVLAASFDVVDAISDGADLDIEGRTIQASIDSIT